MKIHGIILLIFISFPSFCQDYISHNLILSITKGQIQAQYGFPADYDVELYKVLYTTNDIRGELDTASGLLVIPSEFRFPDDETFNVPTIIFHHGTVNSRTDVPSNLEGGFELNVAFASKGYFSLGPDYIGNGESRGFHPYVHADSEASASIDMLKASAELAQALEINLNEKLFLSGYSQGGHASMATHRELETNFDVHGYKVTAAAHLSGPYSIGEVMRDKILSDDEYLFASYIPNTVLSYQEAYGNLYNDLNEVFKPNYIPFIQDFRNGTITLGSLNTLLLNELGSPSIPKNMFLDNVIDSVSNNPNYPMSIALKDNNVYNFAPQAPTRMFYCMADDQVPFENSVLADSVMNALGGLDVDAIDVAPVFDHGQCVVPTLLNTVNFFEDFLTSTKNVQNDLIVELKPNPFFDEIVITIPETQGKSQVVIHTIKGQKIFEKTFDTDSFTINTSSFTNGIYMIKISNGEGRYLEKIIK